MASLNGIVYRKRKRPIGKEIPRPEPCTAYRPKPPSGRHWILGIPCGTCSGDAEAIEEFGADAEVWLEEAAFNAAPEEIRGSQIRAVMTELDVCPYLFWTIYAPVQKAPAKSLTTAQGLR